MKGGRSSTLPATTHPLGAVGLAGGGQTRTASASEDAVSDDIVPGQFDDADNEQDATSYLQPPSGSSAVPRLPSRAPVQAATLAVGEPTSSSASKSAVPSRLSDVGVCRTAFHGRNGPVAVEQVTNGRSTSGGTCARVETGNHAAHGVAPVIPSRLLCTTGPITVEGIAATLPPPLPPWGMISPSLVRVPTPGYALPALASGYHSSQPLLSSSPLRWSVPYPGGRTIWLLDRSSADPVTVQVRSALRTEGAPGPAPSAMPPPSPSDTTDSQSRRATFKRIVLGSAAATAAKKVRTDLVTAEAPTEADATGARAPACRQLSVADADAVHAMTELRRRAAVAVPPQPPKPPPSDQPRSLSSRSYRQMKHPHPSIVPSLFPSSSVPSEVFPTVTVLSDAELKANPVSELAENDIVLGRGGHGNYHAGNVWFRDVVHCYRMHYCVLIKGDKMQMARNLANWFYLAGARFLVRGDGHDCNRSGNDVGGCWYEAGHERAAKKCSQALREGTCAVVRKTLEESILTAGPGSSASPTAPPEYGEDVDGDAATGFGSQSNTVTPTSQLEERTDDTATESEHMPGTKRNNGMALRDLEASFADEDGSWAVEAQGRLTGPGTRGFKLTKQRPFKAAAKKWDSWRKRPKNK